MLNCDYCDYYSAEKGKKFCEFSDHLFLKNPLDLDKYPCEDISFANYLEKKENKNDMNVA